MKFQQKTQICMQQNKEKFAFFREIRSQLIGQKTKKDHKIYNSKYKINKVINHI